MYLLLLLRTTGALRDSSPLTATIVVAVDGSTVLCYIYRVTLKARKARESSYLAGHRTVRVIIADTRSLVH